MILNLKLIKRFVKSLYSTKESQTMYLECDPQDGVVKYLIGTTGAVAESPAQPDGSLRYDVSDFPVGSTIVQVQSVDSWGAASAAVPFPVSRPAALDPPANLRLSKE